MKIKDLAQIYANISKKPVKTIGIRPGEKIDEKLICKAESLRVKNIGEYYLLRPAHEKIEDGNVNIFDYTSSDDILTADSLSKYLDSLGHLDLNFDKHPGKIIEDIDTKSKK